MHIIVYYLVCANVAWDVLSAVAIIIQWRVVARWHTDMWMNESDRKNKAANVLMAWFVLSLGFARLATVMDPLAYKECGVLSYGIEGCFALMGFATRMLRPYEGIAVALGSFVLLIALQVL